MKSTAQPGTQLPPSVTHGLIAYIGNKRRLLPFLAPILGSVAPLRDGITFLDPMCGSGAVSRLARHLGYTVAANDWEPFARIVTAAALENDENGLRALFAPHGGLAAVVDRLNALGDAAAAGPAAAGGPSVGDTATRRAGPYIARHFAPADTANPRLGEERLFYTAENARFLDAVRNAIDELFPADGLTETDRIRTVLISLVIQEASTHANTSGVFKAYHRGFGGHGRDALSRIMAPMHLEVPVPVAGPVGSAGCMAAERFISSRAADVCYLDPPYNSHQYGSNYFMLNTITRWDKPPVSEERDPAGRLTVKAGIRPDWTATKSRLCSAVSAPAALAELVDGIDAGVLVLSYSDGGVISPEEVADILAVRGSILLHGVRYTAYRGGRQSATRTGAGRELVFVVDCHGPRPVVPAAGATAVSPQLGRWRLESLLASRFVPERLREEFSVVDGVVRLSSGVDAETADCYRLGGTPELDGLSNEDVRELGRRLQRAACTSHVEEFHVLLRLLGTGDGRRANRAYERRLLTCLRKYAHRKYREEFSASVRDLRELLESARDSGSGADVTRVEAVRLEGELNRILALARARFGGVE